MKKLLTLTALALFVVQSYAQSNAQHIDKLEIGKKAKKVFSEKSSDSTSTIHIDTLILGDKASLQFYAKKSVNLIVDYAIIGKEATISGTDSKNNGTNFDISINIKQLGSLYIIAKGEDAFNGTKTFPNGNGGNVKITFPATSISPQRENKKDSEYLYIANQAGGRAVNANSDLRNIYDRVKQAPTGLRGIPQGQIYSGSAGTDGKTEITYQTLEIKGKSE